MSSAVSKCSAAFQERVLVFAIPVSYSSSYIGQSPVWRISIVEAMYPKGYLRSRLQFPDTDRREP